MTPTLSILIPTLPSRAELLARLMDRLAPQASDRVSIVMREDKPHDRGGPTIGQRRQRMLEAAETPFLAFIDDDDLVSADYVASILAAIDTGADVVGFRLRHFVDGALAGFTIHSLACGAWRRTAQADGMIQYERTPNHLNPVRREMALAIGYEPMQSGEDAHYSRGLFARFGATMKEVFIDRYLYDYLFRHKEIAPIVAYDECGRLTREGMEEVIRDGGSVMIGNRMCTRLEQLP